jgi:endoglucanase
MKVKALMAMMLFPVMVFGYGVEQNAGLRAAEKRSPTEIKLYIGPGFGDYKFKDRLPAFQVVSATDKDFQKGVAVDSVTIDGNEPDAEYPAAYSGPKFERHFLTMKLPADKPMKKGHKYWVRIVSTTVLAKNHAGAYIYQTDKIPKEKLKMEYGLREYYVLTPSIIHLMTGSGIDLNKIKDITVSSSDDPDFSKSVKPQKVGRRSNLDFYVPRGWPWKFHQRHELFLMLPKSMKEGRTYTIDLNGSNPVTFGTSKARIKFNSKKSQNLAIKVNQYGYLPNAQKIAYLGMWMGDANAADFSTAKNFEVCDGKTGKTVFQGPIKLKRKATYKLENGKQVPDPKKVKGPETVYKQDLSYEDVYEMDFSPFSKTGKYFISIPGFGRSFRFRIAKDIYSKAFKIQMNGLLHQRCGIELKKPFSKHYRAACHRKNTEYSTAPKKQKHGKELVKYATDGIKHDLYGGHHDAGDWLPRSHIEVAEILFLLYELNPKAFYDGQLNIPENKNGIPDILDEAWWALDLFNRLQAKDGGVHCKIETNGDPMEFDMAETDRLREFAYRKEPGTTYRYAALAAQASMLWKKFGKKRKAAEMLKRAEKAWNWAEKNGGDKEKDYNVFAAAMLFKATGDEKYDDAFKKYTVYAKNHTAPPFQWSKYDQRFGSFYYARNPKADPEIKKKIIASFESLFKKWRSAAETTNYRYMRSPYAPNTWGTGGIPKYSVFPVMTMHLTEDPAMKKSARQWMLFTNDFSLGCHPMNMAFTVGQGQRYVTSSWHHSQIHSPEGIIPGLQSEGAGGKFICGGKGSRGMSKWPGMSMYPAGMWPDLYKYSENASPGMNEGVAATMAETVLSYGFFVPEK